MITVDAPDVVADVTAASVEYEEALRVGDVERLISAFWHSGSAIRFGDDEELIGFAAIARFRRESTNAVAREVRGRWITTFGRDVASVSLLAVYESGRFSRQSQTWVRTDEGWRVAAAHVSWPLRSRDHGQQKEEL